jgi:WD40 repeat protein
MKCSATLIIIISISITMSACGPGQILGPTLTPTQTSTNTPTITPSLTLTPSSTFTSTQTPTPTPAPISVGNVKSLVKLKIIGEKVESDSWCPITISPDIKYSLQFYQLDNYAIWNTQTGQEISTWSHGSGSDDFGNTYYTGDGPCGEAAFSPDGKTFAMGDYYSIALYDTSSGLKYLSIRPDYSYVDFLEYSPDNKVLLSITRNIDEGDPSKISLWKNGGLSISSACGLCWLAAFSPDGKTLALNSFQRSYDTITILDASTLDVIQTFDARLVNLADLAFSPDGKMLAAVDQWQTVTIWDVDSGDLISSFTPRKDDPTGKSQSSITRDVDLNSDEYGIGNNSMTFSPDGKILAIGYDMGSIVLWDVATTQPVFVYKHQTPEGKEQSSSCRCPVESISFSTDGSILASSNLDNTITLWGIGSAIPGFVPEVITLKPGQTTTPTPPVSVLTPTVPVLTWAPLPQPPLYDDFEGAILDSSRWQPADPNTALEFSYLQKDGDLVLEGQSNNEASRFELSMIQPYLRTIDQVRVFEAQLMVPMQADGVWSQIGMGLSTELPKPWGTGCYLTNLTTDAPLFGCVTFEKDSDPYFSPTRLVQFGQWYTVRMEMDPAIGAIQTYLDGILIEQYLVKDASTLQYSYIRSKFYIWTYELSPLVAEIDNVRITGGALP